MITLFLNELSDRHTSECGGKAENLARMWRSGFPVPAAYVVMPEALELTLANSEAGAKIERILQRCDCSDFKAMGYASKDILKIIIDAKVPDVIEDAIADAFERLGSPLVAVRSSATFEDQATTSAAGQLDSFMNVAKQDVLLTVKHCWSSLFSKRVLWHQRDPLQPKRRCAVIVQRMIPAEVAGVAFSAHPDFSNQILIEAGLGLGESVVSGAITPDRFVLDATTRSVIDRKISYQSKALIGSKWFSLSKSVPQNNKLTDSDLARLGRLVKELEINYGHPVDVEWAKDSSDFSLVQCRPIIVPPPPAATIDASTFDFLWRAKFSYFFCSIYLESGYLDGEFISFHNDRQHALFVSKAYRKMLGDQAMPFYTNRFCDYEKRITTHYSRYSSAFGDLLHPRLEGLSDMMVACKLESLVRLVILLWKDYFITECHSTDTIEAIVRTSSGRKWEKNVERMARLKFMQRKYLNYTMYAPSIFDSYLNEVKKRFNFDGNVGDRSWRDLVIGLRSGAFPPAIHSGQSTMQGKFSAWSTLSGTLAELYYQQLMSIDRTSTVLSGHTGNLGWYIGCVTVIGHADRDNLDVLIENMETGAVLVSDTTGPELLLACKKAGAVITDEGGIISHAALIARELGLPAVIGTLHATQVLRNGDWVEVDANNGRVRILKRASSEID